MKLHHLIIMQYASVLGDIAQGKIRVPKKGRWAHINVKLLHFYFLLQARKTPVGIHHHRIYCVSPNQELGTRKEILNPFFHSKIFLSIVILIVTPQRNDLLRLPLPSAVTDPCLQIPFTSQLLRLLLCPNIMS